MGELAWIRGAVVALLLSSACGSPERARLVSVGQRSDQGAQVSAGESAMPLDVELFAWRAGEVVVVVAQGHNGTAGFETNLLRLEDVWPPILELSNLPPREPAAQVVTPFREAVWIEVRGPIAELQVHVGSEAHLVKVREVSELEGS